jgi:Tfp pilus assembly ATPase PilU
MQTFDQSLLALLGKKLISAETALAEATSPSDLKLAMEGITAGAGKK